MTLEQIIAFNAPVIAVVIGLFAWLRADIKSLEDKMVANHTDLQKQIKALEEKTAADLRRLAERFDSKLEGEIRRLENKWDLEFKQLAERFESKLESEIRRLEDKWDAEFKQLEEKMEAGFSSVELRLRGVETEQARVAGLLEGLALTGRLPEPRSESN